MASASLWRHKFKSLSFLLPLTTAIACTVVMTVISDGFLRDAKLAGKTVPDITMQKQIGGRVERISMDICEKLRALPGVVRVVPRVWGYIPMKTDGKSVAYTLMGVDLRLMPPSELIGMAIEKGRYLNVGEKGAIVVGKIFAEKYNVIPGDILDLKDTFENTYSFKVVGVFGMGVQIYTADLLLTSSDDARNFFNYSKDSATDIAVYTKANIDSTALAQALAKQFQGTRVVSRSALNKIIEQAYGGRGGIFQLMWIMLVLTAVMVAWAEGMSVGTHMKREIGILKAVGWGTGDVIEMKVIESLQVGCFSFVLGTALGLVYILLDAPGIKNYFLGWASIYPDFPIPVYLAPGSIFLIFCIAVFPLLFAMIIPSWLVGVMEPDEAIRG